jgi:hypothetical protein
MWVSPTYVAQVLRVNPCFPKIMLRIRSMQQGPKLSATLSQVEAIVFESIVLVIAMLHDRFFALCATPSK